MTRIAAREFAVLTVYALEFNDGAEPLLEERLSPDFFERLASEDALYKAFPDQTESDYVRRVTRGVDSHLAELDEYIERYAVGWAFGRLPRVSIAIMRVCMYELLYMSGDIPPAAAINAAVEISKKYESPEVTRFTNGILGTFVRTEIKDDSRA